MPHLTPARRIAGVVLALTLPASACSLDRSGAAGGDPDSAPAGSVAPGGDGSPGSRSSRLTTAPPATGPLVETPAFRLRVPAGYTVDRSVTLSIGAYDDAGPDMIFIGDRENTSDLPLNEQVRISRDVGLWVGEVRRLPDVTVDGVTFYHLMGREAGIEHVEEFGAVHGGAGVRIVFNLFSAAHQRREVLQSVLASFEWR